MIPLSLICFFLRRVISHVLKTLTCYAHQRIQPYPQPMSSVKIRLLIGSLAMEKQKQYPPLYLSSISMVLGLQTIGPFMRYINYNASKLTNKCNGCLNAPLI